MLEAERLLVRASELVDDHVRASYAVDDDDLPTDADVAGALRDAACAQYEAWLEVGEANAIDGLAGAQIAVEGYSGPRAPVLAPRARQFLRRYGLDLPVPVGRTSAAAWYGWPT
jgi:hypothetical protein